MRIGTLYDFRRSEEFGEEIGDKDEGRKSITMELKPGHYDINNPIPSDAPINVTFKPGGFMSFAGEGVRIGTGIEDQDAFIYCLTEENDPVQLAKLGYLSGFEVHDVSGFHDAITSVLSNKVGAFSFARVGKCVYKSRDEDYNSVTGVPPTLIKEPKYSYQREYRIVWRDIRIQDYQPIVLNVPNARKFCHRF